MLSENGSQILNLDAPPVANGRFFSSPEGVWGWVNTYSTKPPVVILKLNGTSIATINADQTVLYSGNNLTFFYKDRGVATFEVGNLDGDEKAVVEKNDPVFFSFYFNANILLCIPKHCRLSVLCEDNPIEPRVIEYHSHNSVNSSDFINEFGEQYSISYKYPESPMLYVEFKNRSEVYINEMLNFASTFVKTIKEDLGEICMLCYGTLLGAVRSGNLIPHDDDMDLSIIVEAKNSREAYKKFLSLLTKIAFCGIHIKLVNPGLVKIFKFVPDVDQISIDVFLGWFDESGKVSIHFLVDRGIETKDVLPFRELSFIDRTFFVPNNPEVVLEYVYGKGWKHENSAFKYTRADFWDNSDLKQFNEFIGTNNDYWEYFYSGHKKNVVPDEPSDFACWIARNVKIPECFFIELGTGTGRDLMYLSHDKRIKNYLGLDYAFDSLAIVKSKVDLLDEEIRKKIILRYFNCYDPVSTDFIWDEFLGYEDSCPVVIYSRFFLHAITPSGLDKVLDFSRNFLHARGGIFIAEFRTTNDQHRSKVTEDHYRNYINIVDFIKNISDKLGVFKDIQVVTGSNFANMQSDNAHVARIVVYY